MQFEYCVPEAQRLADLFGLAADIQQAIRFCDLHIEIDPTEPGISSEEAGRREDTRQGLCKAALVAYGRSFASGVRPGLDQHFVARLSQKSQKLHPVVKALRDKWAAHAVNHFEDIRVRISATIDDDGELKVGGVSIFAHMVGGFVQAWMLDFRLLCAEVHALVMADQMVESERLSNFVAKLPREIVMSLPPTDAAAVQFHSLEPKRARRRFSSTRFDKG